MSDRRRDTAAAERAETPAERYLRERAGELPGVGRPLSERARLAQRSLNVLIRTHNQWHPIERNLPVHPLTGEWVTAGGRSFLRSIVGPEWILREFPAEQ